MIYNYFDEFGCFGEFGGKYVFEILMKLFEEVEVVLN